eukprot:c13093_g1_i1 orf=216-1259(-)
MAVLLNITQRLTALSNIAVDIQFRKPRSEHNGMRKKNPIVLGSWEIQYLMPELKDQLSKTIASSFAAMVLLSSSQALAKDIMVQASNVCQGAPLLADNNALKPDDTPGGTQDRELPFAMGGMTARNFNPARYAGRWYEVASLKSGFAGQGQEDCHCTQGVYTLDEPNKAIRVDTFCVHGSPTGYITGIRGKVTCVSNEVLARAETETERQEMIKEKCYLKFPFLPFIPKEPYDVIDTDYDTFALVSGAKDKSFVQIYSRTPNPGAEFIEKYKAYLANIGYDAEKIKDTPQDCEVMSMQQLDLMMSMPGMQETLSNRFPDFALTRPVQFNPLGGVFDTLKKLFELYFK